MRYSGVRVRGRMPLDAIFPAGVASVRTRRVTLPGGMTLRVAESGDAGAPPVLLMHGWGASIYMWRAWFEPLAAAGFRVIAIDLPGHGLSDKPEGEGAYALDAQVGVLRELFHAEGLHGASVVAQSMSGTIALELALGAGTLVGRLALVNPAAFGRVRLQPLARLVSPPMVEGLLRWLPPRWMVARAHRLAYADGARVRPTDVDEYWAPSQDAGYARAMRRLLHEFRWRREPADLMAARLSRLTHAALVVLGRHDHLVHDARPYVAALVRAGAPLEVMELDEGGHAVNEERPELVIPRVLAHLR